jgi:hypothetical protein
MEYLDEILNRTNTVIKEEEPKNQLTIFDEITERAIKRNL